MKKKNVSLFLVAGLIATTVSVVVYKNFVGAPKGVVEQSLFDQSLVSSVDRVELAQSGKRIVLLKKSQDEWVIGEEGGFTADARQMAQLFDQIVAMKIERTVSRGVESQKEYGLGDGAMSVALTSGQKNLMSIELGDSRGGGGQFFKQKDGDSIFLSSSLVSLQVDDDAWIYKELVKLPRAEVESITWESGKNLSKKETYGRSKAEDSFSSVLKFVNVREDDFTHLLGRLEKVSFQKKVARAEAGGDSVFQKPSRRLTVKLFGGQQIEVLTGAVLPSQKGFHPVVFKFLNSADAKASSDRWAEDSRRIQSINEKYVFLFDADFAMGKSETLSQQKKQ